MKKLEERLQKHIDLLVERYPALKSIEQSIIDAYLVMEECYENGGSPVTVVRQLIQNILLEN